MKDFTVQRKETVRESDQKGCKRMKYWRRKRKPEGEVCGEKDEWIMWKEIRRNKELILRKNKSGGSIERTREVMKTQERWGKF